MKGLHAEVRAKFNKSVEKYIIVSRILQGQDDLRYATVQEQKDVVLRFNAMRDDMKSFQSLKSKDKQVASSGEGATATDEVEDPGDEAPKTGFWHTRNLSLEDRRKLHALKDAWKRKKQAEAAGTALNPRSSSNLSQVSTPSQPPTSSSFEPEDEAMERAIRESVAQTSRGDRAEDAHIEAQIRASVREMRRVAEENRRQEQERGLRDWKETPASAVPPTLPERGGKGAEMVEQITDEEFEALIAEAVKQSMGVQSTTEDEAGRGGVEEHGVLGEGNDVDGEEDEAQLRRALEESLRAAPGTGSGGDGDEELKRAMEESERAHQEHLARRSTERSEEEIIMEYVKKQSLAEEEFRRQQAKGKGAAAPGGKGEDEDEDLRRALEESLRLSGKEGGPSGSA